MADCITYRGGYKYQLLADYQVLLDFKPTQAVDDLFYIKFDAAGLLMIGKGYAWDGPSGPTIDTPDFMRGSLVHDALYQLMREGKLDHKVYRDKADRALQRICREDGMSVIRASWVYQGVHHFGDPAADPSHDRPPKKAGCGCGHLPIQTA